MFEMPMICLDGNIDAAALGGELVRLLAHPDRDVRLDGLAVRVPRMSWLILIEQPPGLGRLA